MPGRIELKILILVVIAYLVFQGVRSFDDAMLFWNKKAYKVVNTGVQSTRDKIEWMNEDEVLFSGVFSPNLREVETSWDDHVSLYVWNAQRRELSKYKQINHNTLCYDSGRIAYFQDEREREDTGEAIRPYFVGKMGQEKRKILNYDNLEVDRFGFSEYSCRYIERPKGLREGRGWHALREEHGGIQSTAGFGDPGNQYKYYRKNDRPVTLPMDANDYHARSLQWHEWKQAYFVAGPNHNTEQLEKWQRSGCLGGYWLFPNGRMEKVCIPSGTWAEYGANFIKPFRDGYVFGVKSIDKVEGVYVYKDGDADRIMDGITEEPMISPDGCRVAFSQNPELDPEPGEILRLYTAKLCDS